MLRIIEEELQRRLSLLTANRAIIITVLAKWRNKET
jgi:hypothetical protein